MDNLNFLITPVVGSVIGYFTNWLAIKMLFRPREEKKILGIKLPFTPGIIPKERYRLSNKVGETIGEYFLTDKALEDAISKSEITTNIRQSIEEQILKIQENDYNIDDLLNIFLAENKNDFTEKIDEVLEFQLKKFISSEKNIMLFSEIISNNIINYLDSISVEKIFSLVKENIFELFYKYKDDFLSEENLIKLFDEHFEKFFEKVIEKDYSIKDILNDNLSEKLNFFIKDNLHKIPSIVEEFLVNNKNIDMRLEEIVKSIIEENINSFLVIFINYKKIYESIKKNSLKIFSEEDKLNILKEKTDVLYNFILNKKINDFINQIKIEDLSIIKKSFIKFIINMDKESFLSNIFQQIENNIFNFNNESIYYFIKKAKPDIYDTIFKIVNENLPNILQILSNEIILKIPELKEKLFSFKVYEIIKNIDEKKIEIIKDSIVKTIKNLLDKGSKYIVKSINVSKIIEEQINLLDMEKAESIIITVLNKELNAITILGGVLGFILGFIPIFIK